jgi:hypothetical protein
MSELSIDELQGETGELLPERETLGVIITNIGFANADQILTYKSFNQANNVQQVILRGSFNHVRY